MRNQWIDRLVNRSSSIKQYFNFDDNLYHFGSTSKENRNSLRIFAFLDHQHFVLGSAKAQLSNEAGIAQLGSTQFLEARYNTPTCRDGNQLDLGSSDPPRKIMELKLEENKQHFGMQHVAWSRNTIERASSGLRTSWIQTPDSPIQYFVKDKGICLNYLMAGKPLCKSRWLASSSKPHWQMASVAPASFTWATISSNFSASYFLNWK